MVRLTTKIDPIHKRIWNFLYVWGKIYGLLSPFIEFDQFKAEAYQEHESDLVVVVEGH